MLLIYGGFEPGKQFYMHGNWRIMLHIHQLLKRPIRIISTSLDRYRCQLVQDVHGLQGCHDVGRYRHVPRDDALSTARRSRPSPRRERKYHCRGIAIPASCSHVMVLFDLND